MQEIPKAEIARTKFKLAQVLKDKGVSKGKHVKLEAEARGWLLEVTGQNVEGSFGEADYDRPIAYFLR